MGGMAEALANDGADHPAEARGVDQGALDKAGAATSRAPKPTTRAASKRATRKPAKPKK